MGQHLKVKLNGADWTLKRPSRLTLHGKDLWGRCDYEKRTILVHKTADGLTELDAIVHESLHAQEQVVYEDFAERVGSEISAILWKLGYRKLSAADRRTLGID